MQYQGGKAKLGKHIADALHYVARDATHYYEPFCGACGVLRHVSIENRYASDMNRYMVALWQRAQSGWVPPKSISEEQYRLVVDNPDRYPDELVAFVSAGCSFAGKWRGGYARNNPSNSQDFAGAGRRNVIKCAKLIQGVEFKHAPYWDVRPVDGSLVYCDPPYLGTTGYQATGAFDHDRFWHTVGVWSRRCIVAVSEFTAPAGWVPIWALRRGEVVRIKGRSRPVIERLFVSQDWRHLC